MLLTGLSECPTGSYNYPYWTLSCQTFQTHYLENQGMNLFCCSKLCEMVKLNIKKRMKAGSSFPPLWGRRNNFASSGVIEIALIHTPVSHNCFCCRCCCFQEIIGGDHEWRWVKEPNWGKVNILMAIHHSLQSCNSVKAFKD